MSEDGSVKKSEGKIRANCRECGKALQVPKKYLKRIIKCPACKKQTIILPSEKAKPSAGKAKGQKKSEVSVEELAIAGSVVENDLHIDAEARQADNAWRDFQETKKESYWSAASKSLFYPFEAIGALLFFVIGVPLGLTAVEAACKFGLAWGGDTFREYPDNLEFLVIGITCIGIAAVLVCISFFCSFLLALIRVSAEGKTAKPLIDGMYHRSNLAAVCAWVALYFGPPLYLGYYLASDGKIFSWSWAVVVLLVVTSFFAPMGLLCSATVSASAGLNLPRVVKGVVRAAKPYAYVFVIFALSAVIFIGFGLWLGGKAAGMYVDGKWWLGMPLRMGMGLFCMFPAVVLARVLGVMLRYYRKELPFEFDLESEFKGEVVPQLVMIAGCAMLFMPSYKVNAEYASGGGKAYAAMRHLKEDIYESLLNSDGNIRPVKDFAELVNRVGEKKAVCPARPGDKEFYGVVPASSKGADTYSFVWIYEKEPTWPDGKRLNVLFRNGAVKAITKEKLEELIAIINKYKTEKDRDRRKEIIDEYSKAFPVFR